jgi:hypothetical protein
VRAHAPNNIRLRRWQDTGVESAVGFVLFAALGVMGVLALGVGVFLVARRWL